MAENQSFEIQDTDFHGFLTREEIIRKIADRQLGIYAQVKDGKTDAMFSQITADSAFASLLPVAHFDLSKNWKQVTGFFVIGREKKRVADLSDQIRQRPDFAKVTFIIPVVIDAPTFAQVIPVFMLAKGIFYTIFSEGSSAFPKRGFYFYAGGMNFTSQPQAFTLHVKRLEVSDTVESQLVFDLQPGRHELRRVRMDAPISPGQWKVGFRTESSKSTLARNAAGMAMAMAFGALGGAAGGTIMHRPKQIDLKFQVLQEKDADRLSQLKTLVLERIKDRLTAGKVVGVRTKYGDQVTAEVLVARLVDTLSDSLFVGLTKKWGEDPVVLSDNVLWWFTENEFGFKGEENFIRLQ